MNGEICYAGPSHQPGVVVGKVKLKGSLGCRDHERVVFAILGGPRRVHSKLTAMGFGKEDFGLYRDLLGEVHKLTNTTKLCCVVNTLEGRNAIQKDQDKLESLDCMYFMMFNKAKYNVVYLSQGNSKHKYRLSQARIESNPREKELEKLEYKVLDMICQCAFSVQKADCILHCTQNCSQ
ncbi:hypothetical protein WISP_67700 [Willisornis vidua]|uniref:Uncharacterized protein n=1 Tax=Willisornis vidua TaxID=1566151 RepID=A0ABQ9DD49_9PASS|nr:hypothetical protein WISP_67700 [Willisornis vidua]